MSETQKVGNESIAIQAGGNVSIGLGYRDIKDICNDLFNNNFPQLVAEASKIASENLLKYIACLESKLNDIEKTKISESLKTPNGQYILNESIQNAVRFGNKVDLDLLVEAVKQALLSEEDALSQTFALAESVISKLTKKQLEMILISFYIHELVYREPNVENIEMLTKVIFQKCSFELLKTNERNNLIALGVFSFSPFLGDTGISFIERKYPQIFGSQIKPAFESGKMEYLKKVIEFYDKNGSVKYVLTPVGSAIAYLIIKGLIPDINVSILNK